MIFKSLNNSIIDGDLSNFITILSCLRVMPQLGAKSQGLPASPNSLRRIPPLQQHTMGVRGRRGRRGRRGAARSP